MEILNGFNVKKQTFINFDPRVKVLLLLIGNIAFFIAPTERFKYLLLIVFSIVGILTGAKVYCLKILSIYVALALIEILFSIYTKSALSIMIITFCQFMNMIIPCALLGGILIKTTTIGEFMAALCKFHISKTVIIPLSIMFRYLPVVYEDWNNIKNAMKMRGLSPSFIGFIKHPYKTIECVYTPLLISACNTAEELSAAAITRGIENKNPRTSIISMKLCFYDYLFILATLLIVSGEVLRIGGVL